MTLLYLLLLPMLSGIGMLGLGPALMAGRAGAAHVVLLLSGLLLPLRGLMYLLLARRRGNRPGRMSVVLAAVELLLGAGLLLLPQLSVRLFAVVVAVYLTLLVTVEAVNAILYGRMRRWGAFFPAMAAAVGGTGLFVLIVFVPALRDAALRYTAALLLTVFGTGLVCDVLALTIRSRRVRRVLGSIRVALPDLMSLFLPQRTADVLPRAPLGPVPQQGTEEFELLFQTSAHGIGLVGHCELCFDGRTLTYGAYDPAHQRLLRTVGAGIVFSAPREPYLRWCIGTHPPPRHQLQPPPAACTGRAAARGVGALPADAVTLAAGSSAGGLLCRAAPQARRRAVLARAARAVCNVLHPDDQLRLPDEQAAGENGHRPHGHARAQDAGRLSRPARARISGRKSGRDGPPGL